MRLRLFLLPPALSFIPLLAAPGLAVAAPAVERIVVHKSERVMQLVSGNEILRTYRIALGRNPVGAKRRAGDCRTPEGTYFIDRRNGRSRFHKSLHISYPNRDDLAAARKRGISTGGDIMIHGLPDGFDELADSHFNLNWTKGCIAVNNKEMDEIWGMVADGTPIIIRP